MKRNNLTNRGHCSAWKFPFSNQENTALSGLWPADPFPPTAQQSATSEGLLLPPLPGNVRQLPSKAARKRGWTAKGHPSGTYTSTTGQVFSSVRKKLCPESSRPADNPNLAHPLLPAAGGGARLPPYSSRFRSHRVRVRGPRRVARDRGPCPHFDRGARRGFAAAPR